MAQGGAGRDQVLITECIGCVQALYLSCDLFTVMRNNLFYVHPYYLLTKPPPPNVPNHVPDSMCLCPRDCFKMN